MDAQATTAPAKRWTLETPQGRNSPIWPPDTGQSGGCERLRRGAGRSCADSIACYVYRQSPSGVHGDGYYSRGVVCSPFQNHTLANDRLSNSFGVLFHRASIMSWQVFWGRARTLLIESQKGLSNRRPATY